MKFIIIFACVLIFNSIPHKADVNLDGKVDYKDVEIVRNHVLRIEQAPKRADINKDGKINSTDVALIRYYINQLKITEGLK